MGRRYHDAYSFDSYAVVWVRRAVALGSIVRANWRGHKGSGRRRCLSMNSLPVQATVTSGHLATGATITTSPITTGCRGHG